jgi:hypothetical protein
MEPLETLQAISLAVKTIAEIESLSIEDRIKANLIDKVLSVIDIEPEIPQPAKRKHTAGAQEKIIESLRSLGGIAIRSEIIAESELEPNVVSALLSKLCKKGTIEKMPVEEPAIKIGRGIEPEFMYKLVSPEL